MARLNRLYIHSGVSNIQFMKCHVTTDLGMAIPFRGSIGSIYMIRSALSDSNYDQLIEHIRRNSPQYDYPR